MIFFLMLAILCLGLLNWQLCLVVVALVLIINNPVVFITILALIAIPVIILAHLGNDRVAEVVTKSPVKKEYREDLFNNYNAGDVVHIQRSDNAVELCRIIAIDKTSAFPYNVESVNTGFKFFVTSKKIIQKES